ncbi:MAG: starvation-sensing protein RspA [Phormidesmis sp. FL-bin-119]|nr:starvation-sensing protein RspA [Pedobacter sp.]
MENFENNGASSRRDTLKMLALGSTAGLLGLFDSKVARADSYETPSYQKGLAPVTITKVRAILTAPGGSNLVIVKVETSEPGLYGVGCATFTQRAAVLVPAVDIYLNDFAVGRDVDNIEDIWMATYVSSYWRNGPVLNNALSGLDQALWDIKGKRAKMPVYQLLGGRSRINVDTYVHASSPTLEGLAEQVQGFMEKGWRHIRIQQGGYGARAADGAIADFKAAKYGRETDAPSDMGEYLRSVPRMFDHIRKVCGEKIELLHDMHEQPEPIQAINMIKQLEQYRPFFIEDPFSPENMPWFKQLRATTSIPLAMGELFNNINEFREPMVQQLFDFIRCHISQIGGITPAMKVARLGEWFNVRTAWHGPGDTSPVGHQANNHIDLAVFNFGIQESQTFNTRVQEVFPGTPVIEKGYYVVTEEPGLGIDINEKEAAKYPIRYNGMGTIRKNDGTIMKP